VPPDCSQPLAVEFERQDACIMQHAPIDSLTVEHSSIGQLVPLPSN
jgi:hypothetical protein